MFFLRLECFLPACRESSVLVAKGMKNCQGVNGRGRVDLMIDLVHDVDCALFAIVHYLRMLGGSGTALVM
jgi:hypothetical protein